jgi:myo-inositol-1(or 4)-monophosphatase
MWSDRPVTEPLPAGDAAALRQVAERVAGEAAAHLRALSPSARAEVSTKSSPTDLVTAADTAVEAMLRRRLAELRPGDAVVGEEAGGTEGASGTTWVVDPIDGTVNFRNGLPWYAVSVAAVRDGTSVAGAVAEPAAGRLWSAAIGAGATCDGRPLRASSRTDVALAVVGTGFSYRAERRVRQARMVAALLPRIGDVRRAGSAALDICAVAAGWLDAYLEHGTNWWDWAAAAVIAREAGAVLRTPAGGPTQDGLGADAIFAAAPGIAAELAALAAECGAGEV